jgi:hypothetical protein
MLVEVADQITRKDWRVAAVVLWRCSGFGALLPTFLRDIVKNVAVSAEGGSENESAFRFM